MERLLAPLLSLALILPAQAEMTMGVYIDARSASIGRPMVDAYLRGMVDALAHVNLHLEADRALRGRNVKPMFCAPSPYVDIEELHALLSRWIEEMKRTVTVAEFEKWKKGDTGLANAVLSLLRNKYPCQ
jgi:hypothetical protein